MSVEKIVNNRYNTGDIEFNELPNFKVDDNFTNSNSFKDFISTNMEIVILDELKRIYEEENIKTNYKNYVGNAYLFCKVYEKKDIHFDIIDFFILFVECQNLDFKRLFEYLPPNYRKEMTEELSRRCGKKLDK